jgi:two-component system alkaline phosphatase synthesis response regulator PhoP
MKLMCLSEDESLSLQVINAADRLSWNMVMVRDRGTINQALSQHNPDFLVVDVGGPVDLDWWKETSVPHLKPVIFINENMTEEFFFSALEAGADAFIPRNMFSARYFEARIKSLLRIQRLGQNRRYISRLGLTINNETYSMTMADQDVALTLTEFKILRELAIEETIVVSRLEIQTRVFGEATLNTRSLDVHVCSLRKKITALGLEIDSVRGVGYRLNPCRA